MAEPVFRSRRRRRRRFPTRRRWPPPSALTLGWPRRRPPGRRRRKRPSLCLGRLRSRLGRRGLLEAGRAVDLVGAPRDGLEHEDLGREERLDRLHGDVQRVQAGGDVLGQGRPPLFL